MPAAPPNRQFLPHAVPPWVKPGSVYFITICCRPRHRNQLCQATAREVIFESVEFRQRRGDWYLRLLVLMPDHLHALVSFLPEVPMRKTISDWKSLIARNASVLWQRDFFEHRLRAEESLDQKASYIRENPVRAGLVAQAADWSYTWESHLGGPGRSALPPFPALP